MSNSTYEYELQENPKHKNWLKQVPDLSLTALQKWIVNEIHNAEGFLSRNIAITLFSEQNNRKNSTEEMKENYPKKFETSKS